MNERDRWASRMGLVLAMAGNAIGLGNFLRFPRLAAQYGGGAFLIPYMIALLLLGVPLMWAEWTIGRYGGQFGHSTSPGMFTRLWRSSTSKYLGSLGIALPLLYYTYIESWTLAYACFSCTGRYMVVSPEEMRREIPPAIPGVTPDDIKSMLSERDVNGDNRLSRAEWTGPDAAFGQLDMNADGELDATEIQSVLQPLARAHTNQFLRDYQGVSPPGERRFFDSLGPAIGFWLVTVALNTWIISRGISGGVEKLAKVAMPLLFLFAIVLAIRVLTWGTPDPSKPDQSVWAGLNYMWEPNFAALTDFNVWLAAAGQIFFTLSIGTGAIQCYASYMRPTDDCILTGLTTSATNEFAEVVLGATIAIPIAVATFGLANTRVIAGQGSFDLGFVAMPIIFEQLPAGKLFGTLWFALLFFAGVTSSVALCQPLVAFLQEAFGIGRRAAALVCGGAMVVLGLPVVLWLKAGYLDQYDFWVGTFGLVVFALVEVILFAWLFGGGNMWSELRRDADMRVPRVYYYVIRYVVPLLLIGLLGGWCVQSLDDVVLLKGVPPENVPYIWLSRASILLVIVGAVVLVAVGRRWKRSLPA
jgi:NSS family neurotransmitter:Na+ symporter